MNRWNEYYQCGNNNQRDFQNQLFLLDNNIIDIKCGGWHTIVKGNNNKYYSFGYNDRRQLFRDIKSERVLPGLILNEYIHKIIKINGIIINI